MENMRHPLDELIEAAWDVSDAGAGTLTAPVREHLEACAECRRFFAELRSARLVALSIPLEAKVTREESGAAVKQAIQVAVAAASSGVSTDEKIGFATMALGLLGLQTLLVIVLKPAGFLILEGLLNWMAPFTFYAIFRASRRSAEREEGSA